MLNRTNPQNTFASKLGKSEKTRTKIKGKSCYLYDQIHGWAALLPNLQRKTAHGDSNLKSPRIARSNHTSATNFWKVSSDNFQLCRYQAINFRLEVFSQLNIDGLNHEESSACSTSIYSHLYTYKEVKKCTFYSIVYGYQFHSLRVQW